MLADEGTYTEQTQRRFKRSLEHYCSTSGYTKRYSCIVARLLYASFLYLPKHYPCTTCISITGLRGIDNQKEDVHSLPVYQLMVSWLPNPLPSKKRGEGVPLDAPDYEEGRPCSNPADTTLRSLVNLVVKEH